jgi:hypothetical protein
VGFNQVAKKSLENFVDSSFHLTYRHPVMKNEFHQILTAVADSVATAQLVTVTLPSLEAIDAAVGFLQRHYVDVDYDRIGCSVTIFGDDQRVHVSESGDGDEGHWVLNLVIPQTAFIDTNAI